MGVVGRYDGNAWMEIGDAQVGRGTYVVEVVGAPVWDGGEGA